MQDWLHFRLCEQSVRGESDRCHPVVVRACAVVDAEEDAGRHLTQLHRAQLVE